jgi:hypothetical protein
MMNYLLENSWKNHPHFFHYAWFYNVWSV